MTKIEQRRKLLAAATPGPWRRTEYAARCCCDDALHLWASECPYWHEPQQCLLNAETGHGVSMASRNFALIVAAVNDYAALLEIAEAAKVVDDAAVRGLFAMSPPAVTYFTALQEALAKWEGQP